MTLQQTIQDMRRHAIQHPRKPTGGACDLTTNLHACCQRTLLVDERFFTASLILLPSYFGRWPEFQLLLREVDRERPNRKAVERLVCMFFDEDEGDVAPDDLMCGRARVFTATRIFRQILGSTMRLPMEHVGLAAADGTTHELSK